MKKRVLWLMVLLLLCGCQNNIQEQEEKNNVMSQTVNSVENTAEVTPTLTSEPTKTVPTESPVTEEIVPTHITEPTSTPEPTPTPEPTKIPDTVAPVIEGLADKTVYA